MPENIDEIITEASSLDGPELLKWASDRWGQRAALASSLSAEDQVLTDMIARHSLAIGIFTIDTGRLPQETFDVLEATRQRYGRKIEVLLPDARDVEPLVCNRGCDFFRCSVEDRRLCCHVRKVLPLRRRLAGLDAWITGMRRAQSATRADVQTAHWDSANGLLKLNPLADWSNDQIWQYIRDNNVPYNALHDKGYPSIGCAPCTRGVADGEDIRAGRWWWETPEHKECGLHVVDGRLVPVRKEGNR